MSLFAGSYLNEFVTKQCKKCHLCWPSIFTVWKFNSTSQNSSTTRAI